VRARVRARVGVCACMRAGVCVRVRVCASVRWSVRAWVRGVGCARARGDG
jgi:hypothetical protein